MKRAEAQERIKIEQEVCKCEKAKNENQLEKLRREYSNRLQRMGEGIQNAKTVVSLPRQK